LTSACKSLSVLVCWSHVYVISYGRSKFTYSC